MLTDHIDLLQEACRNVQGHRPFQVVAMMILQKHLHALWNLPQKSDDYPSRWETIKIRGLGQASSKLISIPDPDVPH